MWAWKADGFTFLKLMNSEAGSGVWIPYCTRVLRKLAATSICPHLQISIQQEWELGNGKKLLQTLHREGKKLGSDFSYWWGSRSGFSKLLTNLESRVPAAGAKCTSIRWYPKAAYTIAVTTRQTSSQVCHHLKLATTDQKHPQHIRLPKLINGLILWVANDFNYIYVYEIAERNLQNKNLEVAQQWAQS